MEVIHTRPFWSIIGLCGFEYPARGEGSIPQYGEGTGSATAAPYSADRRTIGTRVGISSWND